MEKLSMCRVCLEEGFGLHSIVETHLQEMYESLVLVPFETKDSRPVLACYICRARLQNCYELRRSCLQSEELFTQMLRCKEVGPVILPEIDNKKRLTIHHVARFSLGHVLQMSVDNDSVEELTSDDNNDVKVEQSDSEDIDEDALEENSVYDNIQYADSDSDDDPVIIIKVEQSRYRISDPTSKESDHAAQRDSEDLPSSNLKERDAADKTAAKSTNEVTFTLNDNNKERSTSVPHSDVQYSCDMCQRCYTSKCKLERHICLCSDVWKKDLSRENSTSSHTHTGEKAHQCHVCEKILSRKSQLTIHMRTHTGEKPHHCDICKKQFTQKTHLRYHMRTHTGEKPYHCHVCEKQFSLKNGLAMHMRTHTGEKPYRCDVCEKQFSLKSGLVVHMRTHSGKKPYQCNICKKCFSQGVQLNSHMRTHTGEKPYHCYTCKKQFTQGSSLTQHMRTHTGEKPYDCYICKKKFSKKSSLTQHMRTHTGEKPYHCYICKKRFSSKGNLNDHMPTHTGEKPYQCNICEKCYSVKGKLARHIQTHTSTAATNSIETHTYSLFYRRAI